MILIEILYIYWNLRKINLFVFTNFFLNFLKKFLALCDRMWLNRVFLNLGLQMQPEFVNFMQKMAFVEEKDQYVLLHMWIRSWKWLI